MKIDAPVQRVRLLEDRALVTRIARLDFEEGLQTFEIAKVSPILADKTLTVRFPSSQGLQLTECRVVRRSRASSEQSEEAIQELADRVQALADKVESLTVRLRIAEESEHSVLGLLSHWLKGATQDVHWGRGKKDLWREEMTQFVEKHRALQENRLMTQGELEDVSAKHQKLKSQLAQKQTPAERVEATIFLTLECQSQSQAEVEVRYVVPSACWRPCHIADWTDDSLEFESQACVWQNTGEDWVDVELSFSTQRATLGTSPPRLSRDILTLKKKQKQVVVQARETSVIVKHQKVDQVPGIDDGGEILTLQAAHTSTVTSSGRPHRIPLFSFSSKATKQRLVLAELAECVLANTKQRNEAGMPLLPGPVKLVKSNGLVGRTVLDYTSPGEEFLLSWGAEPAVSVHREELSGKEETSVVSSWKTVAKSVKIYLRNQTTEVHECLVRERVPVSELKEVKIIQDSKRTTGQKVADSHGFVEWDVRLEGRAQKTLELHYDVQKKKKVVES